MNRSGVLHQAANRLDEPNNHDNMIGVFIAGGLGGGLWTARLHNRGDAEATFHAWIERFDPAQSSFVQPDNRFTLGSISCGQASIVVGSYDAHKAALPVSYFSSSGPTRDGRQKPEVSAPGHNVLAAWSRTFTGVIAKSGTSMAAPAVTGLLAGLLGETHHRGATLDWQQIRNLLIEAARRNPPDIATGQWNERWGHGRVSATMVEMLDAIAPRTPRPTAPTKAAVTKPERRRAGTGGREMRPPR